MLELLVKLGKSGSEIREENSSLKVVTRFSEGRGSDNRVSNGNTLHEHKLS
jgi:hypothetical protein